MREVKEEGRGLRENAVEMCAAPIAALLHNIMSTCESVNIVDPGYTRYCILYM